MTLDEGIQSCKDLSEWFETYGAGTELYDCGKEHRQLAEWLEDYKRLKEHTKTIDPSDDRFGEMLNYAVRYALGRRSYAVGDTVDFVMPLIPYLTTRTLYVMHRDIKEQAERDLLGMECDKADWMKLYKAIGEEMERRKDVQT